MSGKRIAIYGKGGIGKTTISVNLALLLARRGLRTLLVGCDPKTVSYTHLDVYKRQGIGRRVEPQPPGRVQRLIHCVHGHASLLGRGRPADHRPGVALQMYAALDIRLRADSAPVCGDTAQEPPAVPQFAPADLHLSLIHIFTK